MIRLELEHRLASFGQLGFIMDIHINSKNPGVITILLSAD